MFNTNVMLNFHALKLIVGNEDALNLKLNSISSLPINTYQKMYYAVETVIFVDSAIFSR